MFRIIHLKNDLRLIMRDTVMVALFLAPLLLIIVFKLVVVFLLPYVSSITGIDPTVWQPWIFVFVILVNSAMLGTVTGFMMLDDKDGNIAELMSVTPLGRSGYLLNRLSLASAMGIFYTILAWLSLNVVTMQLPDLLLLAVLSAVYSAIIGLVLFAGAENKVKGLTFSKALNIFILFAFADLFSLRWFTVLSWFFPPYWISKIINEELTWAVAIFSTAVHLAWLVLFVIWYFRKNE